MKNRLHPFLGTFASIIFSLGAAQSSSAATLTWDANNITAGAQDGSNISGDIWGVSGQQGNWRNTTPTDNVNWANNDTATFGAGTDGTYSVTVGGAITTGNGSATTGALNFLNSGYTLSATSARQISLGISNSAGYITVASGKTATIGNFVTVKKTGSGGQIHILGGGTLEIGSGGTLDSPFANAAEVAKGSTLWINGGTVSYGTSLVIGQLNAGSGLNGNLIVDSGSLSIGGTGNLAVGRSNGDISVATLNDGTITAAGGNLNFGNAATSTSTFHLNGGILTVKAVTDTNTNSTFNFNGGTLKAAASASGAFMTGLDTAQVRNGGAKFDTNGQSITIGQTLTHSIIGGDNAIDGGLTLNDTNATKGTLILTNANTFTGATKITAGTLSLGNSLAIQNSALDTTNSITGDSTNGLKTTVTTLTFGGLTGNKNLADVFTTTSGGYSSVTALTLNPGTGVTHSYSGDIANGAMSVNKTGSGTQILSGTNTYTGNTSVTGGTLRVNGSLANTTTTISSGATLSGTGSIGGAVTINSGGTLAPGASAGTLAINNTLGLNENSILDFELNPFDTSIGSGVNDLVTGVTSLTLDGLLNVTATSGSFSGITSGTWRLFNYSGSLTNNILTLNTMPTLASGYSWYLDTATSNQINLTIVPEPHTALLAGFGLLALFHRRRA